MQSIKSLFQKPEFGLLLLRVGAGILLALYGWQKFAAGEGTLRMVGSAVQHVGITAGPDSVLALLFGIAAAGAELIGGLLMVIGYMFRPAVSLVLMTMIVATCLLWNTGDGLQDYGHPLLMGVVALGLLFTGPGRLSVQKD